MTEILYTGRLTLEAMERLATDCHFTQEARFLAEQMPLHFVSSAKERENLLRFTGYEHGRSYADTTSGRIFQDDRELRWELQGERIHIAYLGPEEDSAHLSVYSLTPHNELASWEKRMISYYLFGERIGENDLEQVGARAGDLAVVRIPRLLRYPVKDENKPYVRLLVCEYLEKGTEQSAYYRFQGLERYTPKRYEIEEAS